MLNVQRLDWDSEFFGFGIGRVLGPFESVTTLAGALQAAAECGLSLVYGICDHKDVTSRQSALAAGGRLVDVKRTYSLNLGSLQPSRINIEKAGDDTCSYRQLRSLAWQAAEFSRFRLDPALPEGSWRRMYSLWMQNSINGQLADVVLVERVDDRIIGMVTVSHRRASGQIGLFAVDRRWRNRGIGRRLLDAAIEYCRAKKCTNLLVVTQSNNIAACRSYERAGFCVLEEQDIFHFWIWRA